MNFIYLEKKTIFSVYVNQIGISFSCAVVKQALLSNSSIFVNYVVCFQALASMKNLSEVRKTQYTTHGNQLFKFVWELSKL